MFRIGEFAQVAQVSGRLLRYYEEIELLMPEHIDRQTGYRYYSIRQLPGLNRILALKELGLTLDQIGRMLETEVPTSELRGMLALKRSQIEQSMAQETARLRAIESRIAEIDEQGAMSAYDVVMKSVGAQPFLGIRSQFQNIDEAIAVVGTVADEGARLMRHWPRRRLAVVANNDFDEPADLDLEIGFILSRKSASDIRLPDGRALTLSELPAVENMATIIRTGPKQESHHAFGAIGGWMEANRYAIAGPCREVFLEPVSGPQSLAGALVEIQFPVTRAA